MFICNKEYLAILPDKRLLKRGNHIMRDLFTKHVHSIRQLSRDDFAAKGFYWFLKNESVSEDLIIDNMRLNCVAACKGKTVICDTVQKSV